MFLYVPVLDNAGWWLQGAEGPGCQETNPEDDGGEGKTSSVSYTKRIHNTKYKKHIFK